ncbi:hypothetical protein AB0I10_41105 [Streptomyces sp. NPDC050636]|uniref:hypothetical protein n=1 Tax=Streptomyces sp. NPDC050636 TaxID=3154510 RepID=UPI003446228B
MSEVEVLKVGTGRPKRVKIRHLAEEAEGQVEWVSPARLRVPWNEVDAWLEREARLAELVADAPCTDDDPQLRAVEFVFETCPLDDFAEPAWGSRERGLLYVRDVLGFAEKLGVDESLLLSDPRCVKADDGSLTAPWPITLACARQAAEVYGDLLIAEVERQEAKACRDAVHGRYYPGRGRREGTYIDPEICRSVDDEFQLSRDLVRQWCGDDAQQRYDELAALRSEVVRIGKLMEEAISELRTAGRPKVARDLEQRLGVPLDALRHAKEPEA